MSATTLASDVVGGVAPPGRSSRLRFRLLTVVALVAAALVPVIGPSVANAQSGPTVVIDGRGWGHGRGMGQYGALGYAKDSGWTATQILDHFYGGTTSGPAPVPGVLDPDRIRVDLVAMRGRDTIVALTSGTIHATNESGGTLTRVTGALRLVATPTGMDVYTGPGCDGPWTAAPAVGDHLIRLSAETTATDQNGMLQACAGSRTTWYDGELWSVATSRGQRTLNLVSVEQYLRGVVPNEVPASWPEATLQAQSVAARSYVLAGDTRWSDYADTCDSTLCQVYDGRFTTRGGSFRSATHPSTDAAIAATTGTVRLRGDGAVARTEFSSSTGGWTAGGDFPAVVDDGDAVTDNPNARWRTTVDLSSIESSYGRGAIIGIAVVERNGLGPDGGRVVEAELRFERGSVFVDGDTVRRQFGLRSNWFSIGDLTRGGVVQEPIDEQLIARYVDRAYRQLAGRAPTADEAAQGQAVVRSGSRLALADSLVEGAHFSGSLVDDLYEQALGRQPDADGRAYWVATLADGLKYEHLGTLFFGAAEYVNRSGGTNASFVDALYRDILGREPDADGRRYWLDQLAAGRANPDDVANAFYRSIESRRDRARSMHRLVLGGEPGASLVERLAERLATVDDLELAAELAVDLDLDT
ncbi:MAG: DUF4214 domain-containing protein [Actinomycetota bacterium]